MHCTLWFKFLMQVHQETGLLLRCTLQITNKPGFSTVQITFSTNAFVLHYIDSILILHINYLNSA